MKVRRILSVLLTVLMLTSVFAGATALAEAKPLKIICLLNGTLGDKSFFDSSAAGVTLINEKIENVEATYVEMGYDSSVWATTLADVSEGDYDLIIVGTWQMQDPLQQIAPQHPEKKYIIFDSNVDYSAGDCTNVYSISFKQNEASYLAGALAALIAQSKGSNIISAVGAMEIAVINDFIVGYIQGATDTVPGMKVVVSYVGNFNDTATAKELAEIQFNAGSTIGFNVASQAGLGLIQAASDMGKYAIGVDSDQAEALAADGNTAMANCLVSSVLKNIDQALYLSVQRHIDGTLPYGSEESLGMTANSVGLANNDYYTAMTTEEMRATISGLAEKINAGEIKVVTAFDQTFDVSGYIRAVAP
ncbi:MAG: BMP family ABC transporter substrate-binding protein [Clostridia bacterium]